MRSDAIVFGGYGAFGDHIVRELAALPAVYVTRRLCQDHLPMPGAVTAFEALGAQNLIDQLVADGFEFRTDS